MKPETIPPRDKVRGACLNALIVFRQYSEDILEEASQQLGNYTAFAHEHAAIEQDLIDAVDLLNAHLGHLMWGDME